MRKREQWGSRMGLILAMAGNAIGLGNFLRFPVQAANNGGGVFLPLVIVIYYTYICSWTLAFSLFSLVGAYPSPEVSVGAVSAVDYLQPYQAYLYDYIGASSGGTFMTPNPVAYLFFIMTLGLGLWILGKGVAGGIEVLNKIAIPALFVMALVLFIKVLTVVSPTDPDVTALDGLAFLWEPDFSGLTSPRVWLAAAGQIFFTLSLGFGAIITYASYVKKDEDIALDGLSTASLNEFAEVVFGSTIAIVSAVIFFGAGGAGEVAAGGAFKLGFISMPAIFSNMAGGRFFGFLWFLLLFFAGLTSIVALSQPVVAFFEDELGWARKKSVIVLGALFFVAAHLPMFVAGSLDEMDFWAGTLGIVILALMEIIIFFWIFGADRAWEEITRGARIKIPRVFFYLMKYITPSFLIVILIAWSYEQLPAVLAKGDGAVWFTRFFLFGLLLLNVIAVRIAWKKRRRSS